MAGGRPRRCGRLHDRGREHLGWRSIVQPLGVAVLLVGLVFCCRSCCGRCLPSWRSYCVRLCRSKAGSLAGNCFGTVAHDTHGRRRVHRGQHRHRAGELGDRQCRRCAKLVSQGVRRRLLVRAIAPDMATGLSSDLPDDVGAELKEVPAIRSIDAIRLGNVKAAGDRPFSWLGSHAPEAPDRLYFAAIRTRCSRRFGNGEVESARCWPSGPNSKSATRCCSNRQKVKEFSHRRHRQRLSVRRTHHSHGARRRPPNVGLRWCERLRHQGRSRSTGIGSQGSASNCQRELACCCSRSPIFSKRSTG